MLLWRKSLSSWIREVFKAWWEKKFHNYDHTWDYPLKSPIILWSHIIHRFFFKWKHFLFKIIWNSIAIAFAFETFHGCPYISLDCGRLIRLRRISSLEVGELCALWNTSMNKRLRPTNIHKPLSPLLPRVVYPLL